MKKLTILTAGLLAAAQLTACAFPSKLTGLTNPQTGTGQKDTAAAEETAESEEVMESSEGEEPDLETALFWSIGSTVQMEITTGLTTEYLANLCAFPVTVHFDDKEIVLETEADLEELGLEESGAVRLIQGAYHLLGLQTFFTAGADECRAWTIHVGDKAPKAAGVIHSDFEKGFIRAEVIKYEDFVKYKTEAAVRAAGKMGIEGKDYVVQDGDIMHFLFNV